MYKEVEHPNERKRLCQYFVHKTSTNRLKSSVRSSGILDDRKSSKIPFIFIWHPGEFKNYIDNNFRFRVLLSELFPLPSKETDNEDHQQRRPDSIHHAPFDGLVWVATDSLGARIVRATEAPVVVRSDDEVFEIRDFSDFEGYRPEAITSIEFESATSKSILKYTRIDAEKGRLDYIAGQKGYKGQYYEAYVACGSATPALTGE